MVVSWRRGALAVLLFVVKLVFFLYFFGGPSLKSEKKDPIDLHIAFGCSPSYGKGLVTLLHSIANNSIPEKVKLWVFSEKNDVEKFELLFRNHASFYPQENIRILDFRVDEQLAHLLSLIHPPTPPNMSLPLALPPSTSSQQPLNEEEKLERQKQKKLLRRQLFFRQKPPTYLTSLFSDPYNYVRFYMPSLFSSLVSPTKRPSQFLYLDCDTLVLKDPRVLLSAVGKHMGNPKNHDICLAAATRNDPKLRDYFDKKVLKEIGFSPKTHSFNAGVLVVDNDCWLRNNITDKILFWIKKRTEQPKIYQGGSQAPLLLAFFPLSSPPNPHPLSSPPNPHPLSDPPLPSPTLPYIEIAEEWNVEGRNFYEKVPNITCTAILHFTGGKKPWEYKLLYYPYAQKTFDSYAPPGLVPTRKPHSTTSLPRRKTNFQCETDAKSTKKDVLQQINDYEKFLEKTH